MHLLQVYCNGYLFACSMGTCKGYLWKSTKCTARVTYVHAQSVLQGLPVHMLHVYCKDYLCTCSKCAARVTCVHAPSVLQGLHVYLLQVYCKSYLFTCSKCTVRVTCVHAPSVLQCEMNLRSCCLESHVIKTSLFELHPTLST